MFYIGNGRCPEYYVSTWEAALDMTYPNGISSCHHVSIWAEVLHIMSLHGKIYGKSCTSMESSFGYHALMRSDPLHVVFELEAILSIGPCIYLNGHMSCISCSRINTGYYVPSCISMRSSFGYHVPEWGACLDLVHTWDKVLNIYQLGMLSWVSCASMGRSF